MTTVAEGLAALARRDLTTAVAAVRTARRDSRALTQLRAGLASDRPPCCHHVYARRGATGLSSPTTRLAVLCEVDWRAELRTAARDRLQRTLCTPRLSIVLGDAYRLAGYRQATHDHTTHLTCAVPGRPIGATSTISSISSQRAGLPNAYGYGVTSSTHVLRVRRSWLADVAERGIALVDGLLTLDAQTTADPDVLRTIAVRQGRGTSLVEEGGHLVRAGAGAPWVHATLTARSIAQARAASASRQRALAQPRAELGALRTQLAGVVVSRAHARAVGLCDAGIRDWCARHGVDPSVSELPAATVLDLALASGDRLELVQRVLERVARQQQVAS